MKTPLSIGDRVRAYDCHVEFTGEVVNPCGSPLIRIAVPREESNCTYIYRHHKQCRKLIKRKKSSRREWAGHWGFPGSFRGTAMVFCPYEQSPMTEIELNGTVATLREVVVKAKPEGGVK